ncbi:nucleotide exchange factor GrpE [Candidatus Saccharibacteria bacterium]|nr:nucleotide exchange factor GrpE [Candidatus Saccharibacteria bacterium]
MLKKKTQNDENLVNANKQAEAERQQITELTNDLQRTRADFENYRKQMDVQRSQAVEYAKQDTVKQFLPLLDDLDRAITATPELAPLMKNLEKTVKELGLTKINSEPGTDFNPDLHDAVMMEDGEGEKEVIAETLRAGYLYNDAVLRPAMVKVKNA